MANEQAPRPISALDIKSLLAELEVPFPPDQVQWRVTNTAKDKRRGQIVPYADPRAYADRLNALFTPQSWTRQYKVETMNNITRMKKGESIVSGKILVTCTVTIVGLSSHSGTGEDWADDENGMTAADAQAFKRACACFGLDTSMNFRALGLISTRTSNQNAYLRFRPGQFRRTGAKGYVQLGKTATVVFTRMPQMATAIAVRNRTEDKPWLVLIPARMIWIPEFSLWRKPLG